jgi:hypothetical protein
MRRPGKGRRVSRAASAGLKSTVQGALSPLHARPQVGLHDDHFMMRSRLDYTDPIGAAARLPTRAAHRGPDLTPKSRRNEPNQRGQLNCHANPERCLIGNHRIMAVHKLSNVSDAIARGQRLESGRRLSSFRPSRTNSRRGLAWPQFD